VIAASRRASASLPLLEDSQGRTVAVRKFTALDTLPVSRVEGNTVTRFNHYAAVMIAAICWRHGLTGLRADEPHRWWCGSWLIGERGANAGRDRAGLCTHARVSSDGAPEGCALGYSVPAAAARDFFTIALDLGGIIEHANMLHRGANKGGMQ
jgi:hypothetical protein